uniref:Uncharacterized protein n=1 Tax=Aplanochytrium stocchinoi TaxID=215587 RepID=A0A7S3PQC7_9STRA|mmetsp:Transcript_355/g.402  ORF Transcript_355/g.402 Transcript_355/m.402 type:complete len:293 (+) Transcript_355:47-925(+)|eukprot:CAMPEP_0204833162 /NCGR_PEP_ID=MMETSP1346-20131115/15857_1 /ASSEMBLY_ACC=CAM_ASM_000771 /TAXON_ID=215587 /ORGANISM="Aplanochytrium stocchinoi, Strain GSBS06" /LENGTH=292 /DNA_ID=CAMNT_0051965461 /DNA_START=401 /DNA_END=1279 /DNA_ORIENTATION=-
MQSIEERINEGDHYGALQTLKTLLVRASKKKDMERVGEIGRKGSILLLRNGHATAGLDVSLNLVEIWESSKQSVTEETKVIVQDINDAYMTGIKDKAEGARLNGKFLDAAIEWSKEENQKSNSYKRGDPLFHHLAAKAKLRAGDPGGACQHFVHAHQPKEFAALLFQWSNQGYQNERDMFLARAIFQLLAQENLKDANIVFDTFCALLLTKSIKLEAPLFNFVRFLLKTLERDAYPLFKVLRDKYAPVLRSDPSFDSFLDQIQVAFFNVKPQKKGMAAMMENMLGMFGAPPQ